MTKLTRRKALLAGAALTTLVGCGGGTQVGEETSTPPITPSSTLTTAKFVDGITMAETIKAGNVSSSDLVSGAIAKAKSVNPKINAIVTDLYIEAEQTSQAPASGVFSGVPSFVKDLNDWTGAQTAYGSRAFKGNVAQGDGPFIKTWRAGGIVALGKSTTPEMGLISSTEPLITGATRNPWDTDRIPGGSSGGAAALVASRVVPFAHASDGGGSIRIPAACCGLFGLKPSRGALADSGIDERGIDISVNHAVTLTVRDSAALFALAETPSGFGIGNVTEPISRRLKIGFMPDPISSTAKLDPATRKGVEDTAQLCRDLGHDVVDFKMDLDGDKFGDQFLLLWSAGAAQFAQQASLFSGKPPSPEILEPWTLGLAQNFMSRMGEMDDAIAYLNAFVGQYNEWFSEIDVLLTPTVSTIAPKIGEQAPDGDFEEVMANVLNFAAFTSPMNVAGAASMSVPLHQSESGMPVGSMFSAKQGEDGLLFALAYELETARPWINRLPPISA